jgi:SH3-like domain-containing protein
VAVLLGALAAAGCRSWKARPSDHFVFVTAKQVSLRDRVAAVSNRTGTVENGEKLRVLDRSRQWVRVSAPSGDTGWIQEKSVATEATADEFAQLKDENKDDPTVAAGIVRDEVYMHIRPGVEAEHFFLLEEGEKLQLLRRAVLVKQSSAPNALRAAQKAIPQAAGSNAVKHGAPVKLATSATAPADPPPAVLEDWWLARDSHGDTGWISGHKVDVDAPDALVRYSEGQRIVGAYVLTHVHDDGAPGDLKDIPVYVAVMSPYKAGLPYDFDQVRVFTWSTAHHRYETGFRDKNIEGYLPVTIGTSTDPYGKTPTSSAQLPSFSYKVLAADAPPVVPNPQTGAMVPAKTITKTFRMEGNSIRRIIAPGAIPQEEAHPAPEEKKGKKGKKR